MQTTPSIQRTYLPLQGLRVVEFCWVWAGPFLGQFLADLGAEVIKIEWYDRFDVYRTRGIERMIGMIEEDLRREMSPSFHSLNRNKVGFAVNLKDEAGVDLVKKLVAESNMVIENWSSGTLAKLGLGADVLKSINPELVMLSLSAFGPNSRLKDMRSYGLVTSSLAGAEEMIKVDDEFVGSPTFVISDPNAALFGLLGAMGALIQASQSGTGMNLVTSQLEGMLTLMADRQVQGDAGPALQSKVFRTSEDRFVAISIDPAKAPQDMATWCLQRSVDAVVAEVRALGGHAAEVVNVIDTEQSPVFQDLDVRIAAEHAITGREQVIAAPWRINGHRAPLRKNAPLLGEGNNYVLREILKLSSEEIASLRDRKVV